MILDTSGLQREVFAKLGVSSLEELGLEDWSQLLSPGSPNSVSGFHHFEGSQQVTAPTNLCHDSSQPGKHQLNPGKCIIRDIRLWQSPGGRVLRGT